MTDYVRLAVIGGGVVGCSCLYHLARMGWTDAILLEQDELTSGSTWHAAGNCPTFSGSWGIMRLQAYSALLYQHLGAEVDYPISHHITGSVRLAHTRDRMDEFHHVLGMARANGLAYELLSQEELKQRYPLVETHDLMGALWDPLDGDIDPAQLTQAFAKGARALGAQVRRFVKVTGLSQRTDGTWLVRTAKGDIVAEVVVNAAGYRAGEVMALLGQSLPIVSMSHQYLVTEEVQELVDRTERLPLLRDPDASYYLRQERDGFILGPYEWQATPMWLDGIPEDFSYKLWNDDLERLERHIEDACARVPALGTAGVRRVVNGPIPYSPDGNPYIGPALGLRNFFHCNTFSFGICQAGGAGKALAEWVVEGAPEWDLWNLDPRRYTGYATKTYTAAKAVEIYQKEYAPGFPNEERPAGRPLRTSPLYQRLKAKGARFGARGGWERPTWFGDPTAHVEDAPSFRRNRVWFETVGSEVRGVRESVGLLDLPGFTKLMVSGPDAAGWLDRLLCSRLPKPGRIGLTYALDARGRIASEFTVTRLAEDRFYLCSAASAEWHDADLLRAALPPDGVHIEELTPRLDTLVLAGPNARNVLGALTSADLSNAAFPWLSAREIEIGEATVLALRVNYVGELGWELHAPSEHLVALYEALWQAGTPYGIRDFGIYAVDSLRLDKCYRGWKTDLESGFTPLDAGLDRFVDLSKPEFVGRAALLAQQEQGAMQRLVPLLLDEAGEADAPACTGVFLDDVRVGIVTSGGWSHTLGRSVALAYVRADLATAGTRLQIDVLGERVAAMVQSEPLYDPTNARLRA
jgi:dimethylglycine dehydrogenase